MAHLPLAEGICSFCGGTQLFGGAKAEEIRAGAQRWIARCDGCHGPSVFSLSGARVFRGSDTSLSTTRGNLPAHSLKGKP